MQHNTSARLLGTSTPPSLLHETHGEGQILVQQRPAPQCFLQRGRVSHAAQSTWILAIMSSHVPTAQELRALQTVERVASCFSLIGTTLIFITFASSTKFRKPMNRLIFYASWGNTLCNVATMISESGIKAGQASHLCQFQGFLIQMFVPADALWNLAMAINIYMTLFKKYRADQLKALEWKYHIMCYGGPFIIALTLIFVENGSRGKVYGPAVVSNANLTRSSNLNVRAALVLDFYALGLSQSCCTLWSCLVSQIVFPE